MGNLLLGLLLMVLLAACETTGGRVAGDPADPATGRRLYEVSCSRCHALYMPSSFTASEWRFYVKKYGRKARLSRTQKEVVYEYLAGASGS